MEVNNDSNYISKKVHIIVRGKNSIVKVGKNFIFINCNVILEGNNIKIIISDNFLFFGTTIIIFTILKY